MLEKKTASPADKTAGADQAVRHDPEQEEPLPTPSPADKAVLSEDEDLSCFLDAMADVTPIDKGNTIERLDDPKPFLRSQPPVESDVSADLEKLVQQGEGFVVSQTSEYMEGIGYNVNRLIAERLHRGDFSIQRHIDLHGLTVAEAKVALENFLRASILKNERAVLIIHGRGLSSPGEPVLKGKVFEWLTKGPWRKWVIAFTSARPIDGGAGATYLLLRKRPVTRGLKKPKTKPGSAGS